MEAPTYKEIIAQGGARKRRRSDIGALALFWCYVSTCALASLFSVIRHPLIFRRIDPDFLKYRDAFGFWQLTGAWVKAMEGAYFRELQLASPSLEIGYYRGDISALHFEGKQFDFGTEYVFPVGTTAPENFDLWDHVYCDELTQMAARDAAFETVCLVHVIDHTPEIDGMFAEIARVTRAGGTVHFSGFSGDAFRPDPAYRVRALFGRRGADDYVKRLSEARKLYNYLSQDEWAALLARHGLRLECYGCIGSHGLYPWVRYFLHFKLFHHGCFENTFFQRPPWAAFFRRLFTGFYVAIGYPAYVKQRAGASRWATDFFISARRV